MSGTSTNGRATSLTVHQDAQAMIDRAREEGITTVWDRLAAQQPQCGYCALGLSCRNCAMGPCRIDPFGEGPQKGVCGADADVIVARNLGRTIAAGSSSHSDHGRDILEAFGHLARGQTTGYRIADEEKLRRIAAEVGVATEDRTVEEVAERSGGRAPGGLRDPTWISVVRRACARGSPGEVGGGGHYAAGHRPGERRDAPPHAHGRGQRLREHPSPRASYRAGRRLGRIDDRDRTLGRDVRHAEAGDVGGQPGCAEDRPGQHRHARAQPPALGCDLRGGAGPRAASSWPARSVPAASTSSVCAARETRCSCVAACPWPATT